MFSYNLKQGGPCCNDVPRLATVHCMRTWMFQWTFAVFWPAHGLVYINSEVILLYNAPDVISLLNFLYILFCYCIKAVCTSVIIIVQLP